MPLSDIERHGLMQDACLVALDGMTDIKPHESTCIR